MTVTCHQNIKFNAKATLRAYHIYNSLRARSVVFRILHTGLSLRIIVKPTKRSNFAAGLSCKQTISFCVQLSASPPRTQRSKKCNRNPNSPGLFLTVLITIFNPSVYNRLMLQSFYLHKKAFLEQNYVTTAWSSEKAKLSSSVSAV